MKKAHLYTLLDLTQNNGDIRRLKNEGLDYAEIAKITQYAIEKKYIIYKEGTISLSKTGIKELEKLSKLNIKKKKNEWIKPDNSSKIDKISKDFIFLPNQNEIHF